MEKKMRGIHGGVVVVYMGLCCGKRIVDGVVID